MPVPTPTRPWAAWYGLARWHKRAREQRRAHPLCKFCLQNGMVTPVEVVDHVIPHRGDYKLFWFGELQSLCLNCHNNSKKQIESKGYVGDIGADGWPIDIKHPVYSEVIKKKKEERK